MTNKRLPEKQISALRQSTIDSYRSKIKSLQRASSAPKFDSSDKQASVKLKQLVEDFIARTDLSQSTKSTYRSALIWHLCRQTSQTQEIDFLLERLNTLPSTRAMKSPARRKTITETDLKLLLSEIHERAMKSIWAARTEDWIMATLVTGTRPIEWLTAVWANPAKNLLKIKTAKKKAAPPAFGRLNNRNRKPSGEELPPKEETPDETEKRKWYEDWIELEGRLPFIPWDSFDGLDDLDEQDGFAFISNLFREVSISDAPSIAFVDRHMQAISSVVLDDSTWEEQLNNFRSYNDQCRKIIDRACWKVWKGKKKYSLYTFRGQFSANMKALHGSVKTAVLMGHSSADSPSAAHYGIASQAHLAFKGQRTGETMAWKESQKKAQFDRE